MKKLKNCLLANFGIFALLAGMVIDVKAIKKTCGDVNIYMFGDSTSDPGNMVYEPSPGNQIPISRDVTVPIFPFSPSSLGTLYLRFNVNGIPSDDQNFPFYVAKDLGCQYVLGSKISTLAAAPGHFVNFSLSGATQDSNAFVMFGLISPPTQANYGSYLWQVQTFTNLVAHSKALNPHFAIHADDVFFYYSTGANEVLTQYYGLGPSNTVYM